MGVCDAPEREKRVLAFAIPFTLLFFVARTHPWLAIGALYGLMLSIMIAVVGYYNYHWKKKDWEHERKQAAGHRTWTVDR